MMILTFIALLLLVPFVLLLIGFIQVLIPEARKTGKRMLLIGSIWLVTELIVGFSICSNMHFGGGH